MANAGGKDSESRKHGGKGEWQMQVAKVAEVVNVSGKDSKSRKYGGKGEW